MVSSNIKKSKRKKLRSKVIKGGGAEDVAGASIMMISSLFSFANSIFTEINYIKNTQSSINNVATPLPVTTG